MKDTESYVNKAELKRKVRAWLKYRESGKQTVDELIELIERLPVTAKGQLETTLEVEKPYEAWDRIAKEREQ